MISADPPAAVADASAGLARSLERHAITTCAPASHSIFAVLSPMPVLQPVTTAVFPVRSTEQPVSMPIARACVVDGGPGRAR